MSSIPFHPSKQDDQPGATLRDWFAGMAMQGYIASDRIGGMAGIEGAAQRAFEAADALLAARGDRKVEVEP